MIKNSLIASTLALGLALFAVGCDKNEPPANANKPGTNVNHNANANKNTNETAKAYSRLAQRLRTAIS